LIKGKSKTFQKTKAMSFYRQVFQTKYNLLFFVTTFLSSQLIFIFYGVPLNPQLLWRWGGSGALKCMALWPPLHAASPLQIKSMFMRGIIYSKMIIDNKQVQTK